ncbi:MAG TPA: M23 family metallopeptidase [Candidatus Binatia bacterium]|nr:M23 family metallopeptidase [Candidatus Binatia bacterium]
MKSKNFETNTKILTIFVISSVLFSFFPVMTEAQTASEVRPITFPVIGSVTYWDDFGAPRDGGARQHEGNDLMGRKMLPLVAAVDGTVRRVAYPEADFGFSITLQDKDGYTYHYLHVNNDNPGTDDGKGGGMNAYAIDVDNGNKVVAGQLIGWMGDSGNAETTQAHLHFEIRRPDRTPISPYGSLKAAKKITTPVIRPQQPNEVLPFGEFNGGGFISAGNVDADLSNELVVGAGPGGGPHVRVMEKDGTPISSFFPYAVGFRGGVDVAIADIEGDGKAEIITAPHSGGGPHVKIFDLAGREIGGFMAYDGRFTGGVNIAAADMDGDGGDEIITAPGKGGGPHVRVFKQTGQEIVSFFAYDPGFRGGIDVAAYSSGSEAYIATAPGNGGGPHVKVFNNIGITISQFMSYDPNHLGGSRITFAQTNNSQRPEVVTVPLLGGSHIKLFDFEGNTLDNDFGFEEWWPGSWDIAAADSDVFVSVGPKSGRRTSVKQSNID